MSKKILFSSSQLTRKPTYRLTTKIVEDELGAKKVIKSSLDNKFSAHMQNILESQPKLIAAYKGVDINLVTFEKSGTNLVSNYVDGVNLERTLLTQILAQDFKKAFAVIDSYIHLINTMSAKKRANSQDYSKVFGKTFTNEKQFVYPGAIDISLDNIIIDSQKKWNLIDCEWVFNFGIPSKYIISRMLLNFFLLRYAPVFRYYADKLELIEIGSGYVVPKKIIDRYFEYFELVEETITAENNFQKYVLGKSGEIKSLDLLPKNEFTKSSSAVSLPEQYLKIKDSLESTQTDNAELSKELSDVMNSKTYQLAIKISKTIHKIKRN